MLKDFTCYNPQLSAFATEKEFVQKHTQRDRSVTLRHPSVSAFIGVLPASLLATYDFCLNWDETLC